MEPLDREIAEAFMKRPPRRGPARILIVTAEDGCATSVRGALEERRHVCTIVSDAAAAQAAVRGIEYDLVLLDLGSMGTGGLELAQALRAASPAARTIVLFESRSFKQAVQALRCGVVDLVDRRVSPEALVERIEQALATCRAEQQREDRLAQLEVVCRKLVAARQEVSAHLDKLCEDMTAAYEDVSCQVNEVAMATEFRTLLRQELDLEDLLRTALEYLLAKTGPTNAAVFLPDPAGHFELGAYVNYDCPRETITVLLSHLCRAVCPQMADETDLVRFADAEEFARYIGTDAGFLAGCQVIGMSCRHDARCLAVVVLFRSRTEPFDDRLAGTLEILRGIFAEQISNVIKVHHRATPSWPKDAADEDCDYDDFGFDGLAA